MPSVEFDLLGEIEGHSAGGLQRILDNGFDVRRLVHGKPVVTHLTEMYTRSDHFPDCLRLLLDRGAQLDDPRLAPVLLDDADGLRAALQADPSLLTHRTSMVSAFTPLIDATLLHVAAEYGHLQAARVLLAAGADVNATAGIDEHGLNGHTPLFHTVNSNANRSAPLMRLLLDAGARVGVRLPGLVWARPWTGRRRSSTSRRSPTRSSACCRRFIVPSATSTRTSARCWPRLAESPLL